MKRTASDVIRELESRVARLEHQASGVFPKDLARQARGAANILKSIFANPRRVSVSRDRPILFFKKQRNIQDKQFYSVKIKIKGYKFQPKVIFPVDGSVLPAFMPRFHNTFWLQNGKLQNYWGRDIKEWAFKYLPEEFLSLGEEDQLIQNLKKGFREASIKPFPRSSDVYNLETYLRFEENGSAPNAGIGFGTIDFRLQVIFEYETLYKGLNHRASIDRETLNEMLLEAFTKSVSKYVPQIPRQQSLDAMTEPQRSGLSGITFFQEDIDRLL